MKIIKTLILVLLLSCFLPVSASDELASYVDELRNDCPVDFGNGWVAQSYDLTPGGVAITIIADFPRQYFENLAAQGDALKDKFISQIPNLGPQWSRLVGLTADSGLSLIIDMISATGDSTIEIALTSAELASHR